MYLYHLTLQSQGCIMSTAFGNFSAPKVQEVVVGRGSILELFRVNAEGKLESIHSVEIFCAIRSVISFRLTGSNKDYVVVGSDSGKISILEFDNDRVCFKKVHQETFGRSGCRRIVPGEYLAADPRGRAVMIGAAEKQKFVYILNRDSAARLTISSPLEAHKSHTVCFHVVGVDVGFENPIFAAIEVDYSELESGEEYQKSLVFYELDLGLNHIVRKWADPVNPRSNMLVSVPGGGDGPGGVLICSENFIYWKNHGHEEIAVSIPRPDDLDSDASIIITSSTMHRRKNMFFFLLQSEYGDLYKVTLDYENDVVSEIIIAYFDTVPLCNSLSMLRLGFLFTASEAGNHMLYQFQSIGEDDDGSVVRTDNMFTYFKRRPLQNLLMIDEVESLCPLTDLLVKDLARENSPQLYALCGTKRSSSVRVLRHGIPIAEMAVTNLPGNPTAVWTVKKTSEEEYDSYIVVSFMNATLVLSIGETVEEVSEADSGFLAGSRTIAVHQIGDDSLLQVLPTALRNIRVDKRVDEWRAPANTFITNAAVNRNQIVISLSGGEIYYFEVELNGSITEIAKKDIGREIKCLDIAPIPTNRRKSRHMVLGDVDTVRVLSLDADNCLQSLSLQTVSSPPSSISLIEMQLEAHGQGTLFLNIGLSDGVMLRTVLDTLTGELSDTRRRFLGARPVKLFKVVINGTSAVLALSARSWLSYAYQGRPLLAPLSYLPLECATSFCSDQCSEGIVGISGNTLRIVITEKLGEVFNQLDLPVRYTPRKIVELPGLPYLITIESEQHTVSLEQLKADAAAEETVSMDVDNDEQPKPKAQEEGDEDEDDEEVDWTYEQKIIPKSKGKGNWASCIRLFDPTENQTLQLIELDNNESAFSICMCSFTARRGETFIVVGTAKSLVPSPKSHQGGVLRVYSLVGIGTANIHLKFVHETEVDEIPGALCAFQGRLLVGVGMLLRIYDIGKKKLLRKCENKTFPCHITKIETQGDRIVVSDVAQSIFFANYKRMENQIYIFADDVIPRYITSSCMVDFDTVAGGDKFGNIFILRLPKDISEDVEKDHAGAYLKLNRAVLNGAPHKLLLQAQIHVGAAITSIQKTTLIPGAPEILVYTTIFGAIGVLVPFVSREDVDFFSHLEMHMRQEHPPLCGRDHLSYRSYYAPVKDVIDGDLCEQYGAVKSEVKYKIAEELDRKPSEVVKKLEDIRNRCL